MDKYAINISLQTPISELTKQYHFSPATNAVLKEMNVFTIADIMTMELYELVKNGQLDQIPFTELFNFQTSFEKGKFDELSLWSQATTSLSQEGLLGTTEAEFSRLINFERFAVQYLNMPYDEFKTKLTATMAIDREKGFSPEEISIFTQALKKLGNRLLLRAKMLELTPPFDDSDEEELPEE